MVHVPPGDFLNGYKEAAGEASQSRENRRESKSLRWECENEPDEQCCPGLVEGQVHQSKLKELYSIPSSIIHSLSNESSIINTYPDLL